MSRNIFRDRLAEVGITSGSQLAARMECPAVILFFAGPKVSVPYAELRYWDDKGREQVSEHLPRYLDMSMPAMRRKTVQDAKDEAKKALGLKDWAGSPFPNCWMPSDVLQAARERYMEEEKDAEESAQTA